MGVYIKGMAMPHDCDECKLCAFIPVGDYAINRKCMPLNAKAEITIRRKDCPLFPVPPHGDLIDRDAARGSIKPWSPEDERTGCTFDTVKKLMYTMLDRAPTIIPAEEG